MKFTGSTNSELVSLLCSSPLSISAAFRFFSFFLLRFFSAELPSESDSESTLLRLDFFFSESRVSAAGFGVFFPFFFRSFEASDAMASATMTEGIKSSERLSSSGSRRSLKRKVETVLEHERSRIVSLSVEEAHRDLVVKVCTQVEILEASFSSTDFLEFCAFGEELFVDIIVECGAEEFVNIIVEGVVPQDEVCMRVECLPGLALPDSCCLVLAAWLYSAYSRIVLRRNTASQPGSPKAKTATSDMPVLPDASETCVDLLKKEMRCSLCLWPGYCCSSCLWPESANGDDRLKNRG
nr:uncharacterized GPI-anchored protein At4g28100 [Ipomoea batatas]